MKIIPEQNTNLIQPNTLGIKIDTGAVSFFLLGMFLAAIIFHQFPIF